MGLRLRSAFDFALRHDYRGVGHDRLRWPAPAATHPAIRREPRDEADIVSGSRYLRRFPGDSHPPAERRRINEIITAEVNERFGLKLTDAFCGLKAYRVPLLARFELTEDGYAMPLEFWAQAARLGLKIVELAVPLIYLDEKRSFGGSMDHRETRLAVYRHAMDEAVRRRKK